MGYREAHPRRRVVQCPNCGRQAEPDDLFCGRCGKRLPVVELPAGPSITSLTAGEPPAAARPAPVERPAAAPITPARGSSSTWGALIAIGAAAMLGAVCLGLLALWLAWACGLCSAPPRPRTPTSGQLVTPRPTRTVRPPPTVVRPQTVRPPTPAARTPVPLTPGPGATGSWTLNYTYDLTALDDTAVEVMGEAVNTSDQAVNTGRVKVIVTPRDRRGNPIPTSRELITTLLRPVVQPGQKSCFRSFFRAVDHGFDLSSVSTVTVEIQKADGYDSPAIELTVSDLRYADGVIAGAITNQTPYATRSLHILVTLYDAHGKVVDVTYGARSGDPGLKPGDSVRFTCDVTLGNVASFDVLAIAPSR